jgi:hypothetical protein
MKVEAFSVDVFIGTLKAALMVVLMGTPVDPCAGIADTTDGTVTVS